MHYIEYQNISAILRSDYIDIFCIFASGSKNTNEEKIEETLLR